jgi:putative FmdB family regulatory protein
VPLYEYQCPSCGTFEVIQKFSDPALTACPKCASTVEKLLSAPAFQFKGTGWYITDYARKGQSEGKQGEAGGEAKKSGSSDAKSDGAKSESKPDSKAESKSPTTTAPPASTT